MGLFGPPNVHKLRERVDVHGLTKLLGYKDPAIRKEAAGALAHLSVSHVEAGRALWDFFASHSAPDLRESIAPALASTSIPFWRLVAGDAGAEDAVVALGRAEPATVTPSLVRLWNELAARQPPPSHASAANESRVATALSQIAEPALLLDVAQKSGGIAVEALGRQTTEQARAAVLRMAGTNGLTAREGAVRALRHQNSPEAARLCEGLVRKDPDGNALAPAAAMSLASMGRHGSDVLLGLLSDPDERLRIHAASALAGDSTSLPLRNRGLTSRGTARPARSPAAPSIVEALRNALTDSSAKVRNKAAHALWNMSVAPADETERAVRTVWFCAAPEDIAALGRAAFGPISDAVTFSGYCPPTRDFSGMSYFNRELYGWCDVLRILFKAGAADAIAPIVHLAGQDRALAAMAACTVLHEVVPTVRRSLSIADLRSIADLQDRVFHPDPDNRQAVGFQKLRALADEELARRTQAT